MPHFSKDIAKKAAGRAAAELIESGMIVGLGTGSTAAYFIEYLIERTKHGLQVSAIATSTRSREQAEKGGIPIVSDREITFVDLTVDGADEIDEEKRMIKGGGGALLQEKIVASMSQELIIIVDESKMVNRLGKAPLPIEIVPFGYASTLYKLEQLGYRGKLRLNGKEPFMTDNHNYIVDIHIGKLLTNPLEDERAIRQIPGVVETGLFLGMAGRVIIGYENGETETWE